MENHKKHASKSHHPLIVPSDDSEVQNLNSLEFCDPETVRIKFVGPIEDSVLSEAINALDEDSSMILIDLVKLAKQAGGDPGAFFQLFEDQCNSALATEASSVVFVGLEKCTSVLECDGNKRIYHKITSQITTHIDEIRKMGEVSLPVFHIALN